MAGWTLPEMSPWKRQPLTIPPISLREWFRFAVWEAWMGVLVCGALAFGRQLIVTAPKSIVTVYDFTNCYATPPVVRPCERVAYRLGAMNVVLNVWCGLLLIAVALWLLWELWAAVAPKPVTDDFLKLLDDSFGCDWRKPRTWPWTRAMWAYGFPLLGAIAAFRIALLVAGPLSPSPAGKAPSTHVETSQQFRAVR